ncbi:MAG: ThiF family adenylyltransferase [Spirochaetes bacterium]|nr:ThiF family adenylyltransferase [Spirochaetota bacterium]
MSYNDRSRIIFGDTVINTLQHSHICIAGLGGVGAAAAMDLVRSGVGQLTVIDFDTIQESNLNRLYFGYADTVGRPKTEVFTEFAKRINPDIVIHQCGHIMHGDAISAILPEGCDFYLDCIDTLNPKVNLIAELLKRSCRFCSSMGTAGRLEAERLKVGTLWQVHHCTLAAKVRGRLRKLGYSEQHTIPCVWSDEPATAPALPPDGSIPGTIVNNARVRAVQGSAPFVPQAAGHILASLAVRALIRD